MKDYILNAKVSSQQPNWYIDLPKMRSSAKFQDNLNF